jgi:hypothetical protein
MNFVITVTKRWVSHKYRMESLSNAQRKILYHRNRRLHSREGTSAEHVLHSIASKLNKLLTFKDEKAKRTGVYKVVTNLQHLKISQNRKVLQYF